MSSFEKFLNFQNRHQKKEKDKLENTMFYISFKKKEKNYFLLIEYLNFINKIKRKN